MSEDSVKALKDVSDKLETIMRRLDYIESLLSKYPEILEVAEFVRLFGVGARLSNEPIKAIRRLISARRTIDKPSLDLDDTSRLIIQVLAVRGPLNISQITRGIKAQKGKASRKTVRKRVTNMLDLGIVRRANCRFGYRYKDYRFAYELVER